MGAFMKGRTKSRRLGKQGEKRGKGMYRDKR
jgi:hypothetical protein